MDPPQKVDVIIGKPLVIKCPPHDKGIGYSYMWTNKGDFGVTKIWMPTFSPNSNSFLTDDGDLVFPTLTADDVELINDKGGKRCALYNLDDIFFSNKLLLNVTSSGKSL